MATATRPSVPCTAIHCLGGAGIGGVTKKAPRIKLSALQIEGAADRGEHRQAAAAIEPA
jgi:hypothetical protein